MKNKHTFSFALSLGVMKRIKDMKRCVSMKNGAEPSMSEFVEYILQIGLMVFIASLKEHEANENKDSKENNVN